MRLLVAFWIHATLVSEVFGFTIDPHDPIKLQRGAKLFMNYCSGCHSLRYLRYNRMASDLKLIGLDGQRDRNLLRSIFIFTPVKIDDPIMTSMPATEAKKWFGMIPPDLSLIARGRGTVWISRYLTGFYADSTRPFGSNNKLVPDTAMPNVFYPLMQQVQTKKMSRQEYERILGDLLTFLVYVSEPAELIRYRMGKMVVLFLFLFCLVAYSLKKMYWKKLTRKKTSIFR